MGTSQSPDAFTIERHGDVTLITATPALESIDASLEQQVANAVMAPLRGQEAPLVVFDLSEVNYFGSMFLTVLLRCWRLTTSRGGTMALAGVSQHAKELLRLTSLDMIWAMYPTRREAMEALLSD
jgi:anti-sigma B factor antagonist